MSDTQETWSQILRRDAGTIPRSDLRIEGKHGWRTTNGLRVRVLIYTRRVEMASPKDELHWETRAVTNINGRNRNSIIIDSWFTHRDGRIKK